MFPWSSCPSSLRWCCIPARQVWARSDLSPAPSQANPNAWGGQDRLRKKGPERPRWRLWSSVASCLHSKKSLCLSCLTSFSIYLFHDRVECMAFSMMHASVWMQLVHFLAVYRMWRCVMLPCCHCLEIVLLYFWGRGWDGAEMTISIMLTKMTTSVEEGCQQPYFFHVLNRLILVCQRANCLLLATELPGKRAHHKRGSGVRRFTKQSGWDIGNRSRDEDLPISFLWKMRVGHSDQI